MTTHGYIPSAPSSGARLRRAVAAAALLGAVTLATPHAARAFPGFYVPGPRFFAPPVYVPDPVPVYVPDPVYVAPPVVYYGPRPWVRHYVRPRVRVGRVRR